MALPKMPTLQEIWNNPALIEQVPPMFQEQVLEAVQRIEQILLGSSAVPDNPTEMAIAHPRYGWMDTPHIHYMGDQIADTVERNGATVLTVPPRHAKTHTASVWTPFWFLAKRSEEQVQFISYEANFARKWGIKIRALVELFGEPFGLKIDPKFAAGDDWKLTTGGGMRTTGVGGGISGNPAKLLIADDLLKDYAAASSEVVRENTWEWWDSTVMQRIEPDTTTILIGTRYHEDDIIGRVLRASDDGTGLHFDQIVLRAKAEDDDPLGRAPGEGLWPNHPLPGGAVWGQEFYDKRERTVSPYVWSSVYQQRPTPPGGNMVDPSWWRFYRPSELPSDFEQEAQSWDLALDAQKKEDSYHCGIVGSRKGPNVFLRNAYHEHGGIAAGVNLKSKSAERTVINEIRAWKRMYPGARTRLVERSLAGPMLVQVMGSQVGGMVAWPPKGKRKGSKEACLNACIPDIRAGNVLLPLNADGSQPRWVSEFIEELRQFPRAPHDDYVDAFTQLMHFLIPDIQRAISDEHADAISENFESVPPTELHTRSIHAHLGKLARKQIEQTKRRMQDEARSSGSVLPFAIPGGLRRAIGGRGGRGRGVRGLF